MSISRGQLSLSLQFAQDATSRSHREVLPRHFVQRCLCAALERAAEMTVRVVGADEGQQLNGDYRNKPYPTNVLTFDYASEPMVLADLVLCAPVVAAEAVDMGVSLSDHYAHLLVHGALHAQGWDHEDEDEAQEMEALETEILARLGVADPYAGRESAAKG